ncbi:TRAP transporter large permease subunit [Catenovulum sp. 2E275]|uniref:TRAP transporter large permease n=1 Tax=Catenovulum sp. 2E275 TaxID=2980497 RepID=UPI0021D176C7|nr:TRAP transporter large permease subunit [Catenovulum sp. 2E275]MCU4677348.1 TRAP transporter large permease subunit [Catenovulum sp. 2E275]
MQNPNSVSAETVITPAQNKFNQWLNKPLQYFLVILLAAMAIAITYQITSRFIFNSPSKYTQEFLRYALIWLGLIGGGYCFIVSRHLNLPILIEKSSAKTAARLELFNASITLIFGLLFLIAGLQSYFDNQQMKTAMFQIPVGVLQLGMALSGLMIIASQFGELSKLLKRQNTNSVDFLLVLFISVLVGCLIWLFARSSLFSYLVSYHLELFSLFVLFAVFFVFLILGTPIAIGLAFSGLFTLALQVDFAPLIPTAGQTIFNGLDSFGFLALPFFILAGSIMNQTGLARRLIDLAMLIGGKVPGSLWQSNVVANALFGTLSGSGIASASAIGGIINPVAKEKNYDMPMTAAVNAASAPCGMLIPPSGALIVYSLITGGSASIISLFIAGYIPGMIMAFAVMISAYFYAKKQGYQAEENKTSSAQKFAILNRALPSLLLVFIVIGGILGGLFTAIEGSGVAVIYSLLLALLYRSLSVKALFNIFLETAIVSGVILFLIACSGMMSWTMTFASIPDTVGQLLTGLSDNKYLVLLLIVAVLLVVGVFMDMSPAMLIFTPIFFPVVTGLGVDPVHFGIILVYALALGVVTPPVGTVLFVACSISNQKISAVIKPLMPIFLLQLIGLLLITFIPALSLALPNLFRL